MRAIKSILVQWIAFVLGAFVLAGPAVPGARIQVGRSPHSAAHPEFRELEISAASTSSTSISSTALPGWHWPTGSSDFCGYLGWLSYNPRYSGYHLAQDMCNPQGGSVHSIGRGEVVLSSTNVSGYGPGDGPGGALVARYQAADGTWFTALYGHLDNPHGLGSISPDDVIGFSNAYSPPHVHFAIHPGFDVASPDPWRGYTSDPSNVYGFTDPVAFLVQHPAPPDSGPSYVGYVDHIGCDAIHGWVADRNRLNSSISISIYDGGMLVTTVSASELRPDVGAFLGDNGLHGFNIPTPSNFKDGNAHNVNVQFEASALNLVGSPSTLSCPQSGSPNYVGYVDHTGCDAIQGWAADRNRPNTPINVSIYDGAALITTVSATQLRPDVGTFLSDNGQHGFNIPTPPGFKDGNTHTLHLQFEASAANLGGSPSTLSCPTSVNPNYIGYIDHSGCDAIRGWAADKNRLNTPINVSIYDGATLITTVSATQLRSDVGTFLGDNGQHGFNIPTPAAFKDGNTHTLHAQFESGATNLAGSPSILSCPVSVSPQIVVSPGSGFQLSTTFNVTGSGFSHNGTVNRFIAFPGGLTEQISSVNSDGDGNIGWTFTPDCSTQIGLSVIWTVDVPTGLQSNSVGEVINHIGSCALPAITVFPVSGQQLATLFIVTGSGFSSSGTVNRFITFPNGVTQQISSITADASGNIGWAFLPGCTSQVGTYTIWTVDVGKNQRSNNITEIINHNPGCP